MVTGSLLLKDKLTLESNHMISDIAERKPPVDTTNDQCLPCGLLLVRVDQKERLPSVIPHALAVASGLGRRIKLVEVLDPRLHSEKPVDPVDWDIQKHEIQLHLEHLAKIYSRDHDQIDIQVLEYLLPGDVEDCNDAQPPILAFGRHGSELPWHLDETNRNLLKNRCSSILMVPDEKTPLLNVTYRRIVVPLDGSSRAEAVLPIAIAIARKHKAQLSLIHVTPTPSLTRNGPLNAEDRDLESRLALRNERVAHEYLKVLRGKCSSSGAKVNAHVMNEGDARRQLLEGAKRMDADLIILNSHGSGGHGDVLTGSVATFVLEHAMIPVLMIGQPLSGLHGSLPSGLNTPGLRQPGLISGAH